MTREEFVKQLDGMAFNGENLGKFLRENYTLSEPTKTEPTRPKAKWIERDLESYNPITRDRKIYVCSNCHLGIDSSVNRFANYCPNCGAETESE